MLEQDTYSIEAVIEKEGSILKTTVGNSMYPLLRNRKDNVIIEPCKGRLKKFDAPVYKRKDGKYVLHRIIKVRENDYVIRGDNTYRKEYGITDADIIGIMVGLYRNDKYISCDGIGYKLYVRFWHYTYFFRVVFLQAKRFAARVWRKIRVRRQKSD